MDYQKRIAEIEEAKAALQSELAIYEQELNALRTLSSLKRNSAIAEAVKGMSHINAPTLISANELTSEKETLYTNTEAVDASVFPKNNELPTFIVPRKASFRAFLVKTLTHIGTEGKSLSQIIPFYKEHFENLGTEKDPFKRVRTELWKLKTNYGFLSNPKEAFYKVTQSGLDFIESQKGESPTTENSGAFNLQPSLE